MSIHHNYDSIESVALHYAKEHKCNYNIILMNPVNGEFGNGSTYEYVADSYFEKKRPNYILLKKTDDILNVEVKEEEEIPGSMLLNNMFEQPIPYTIRDFQSIGRVERKQSHNTIYPSHPIISDKIGRNETCPCGSGLKYKKCCLK